MSELVADCPRCGAKHITFDLFTTHHYSTNDWQKKFEAFCVCRLCNKATVFRLNQKDKNNATGHAIANGISNMSSAVNTLFDIDGYLSIKDNCPVKPLDHLPQKIEAVFKEGATCLSTECFNAAGTMFRLCLDLATAPLLPKEGDDDAPNANTRRSLGLRLAWLFEKDKLPETLKDLSECIKDDGNDGAHQGTLGEIEAQDILDFTTMLLQRLYTEPKRIELARERKEARRRTDTQ